MEPTPQSHGEDTRPCRALASGCGSPWSTAAGEHRLPDSCLTGPTSARPAFTWLPLPLNAEPRRAQCFPRSSPGADGPSSTRPPKGFLALTAWPRPPAGWSRPRSVPSSPCPLAQRSMSMPQPACTPRFARMTTLVSPVLSSSPRASNQTRLQQPHPNGASMWTRLMTPHESRGLCLCDRIDLHGRTFMQLAPLALDCTRVPSRLHRSSGRGRSARVREPRAPPVSMWSAPGARHLNAGSGPMCLERRERPP